MRLSTVLIVVAVAALAAAEDKEEPSTLNIIDEVLDRCLTKDELDVCLEGEAANALGRALKADSIPLVPGLSLTKSPDSADDRDDTEVDGTARSESMTPYDRIWDNLDRLFTTRSLSIQLSDFGEGRGKKKKVYKYFGVALATAAAILVPIKLKLIAWMAATALMVGKLALVIASMVGLKKLVSKPHEETTHVHYDGHRSDQNAHYLAYSGQQPNTID